MNPDDSETPLNWAIHDLWGPLRALLPDIGIKVVAQSESTNTELLELARHSVTGSLGDAPADTAPAEASPVMVRPSVESRAFGRRASDGGRGRRACDAQPQLLVAEHQTAGRGRQGAVWQSERGASLTFSLMLPLAPSDWSGLSLAVGLALAQALDPLAPGQAPRIGLKWPNDLWLIDPAAPADGPPGRKLGGVLIETVASEAQRMVVVGVGLNMATGAAANPAQLRLPAAGLTELLPAIRPPEALALVAAPLVEALLRFERDGWGPCAAAYAQRDVLAGKTVAAVASGWAQGGQPEPLVGVAQGVAADGGLRLMTAQGEQRVISGDVSIRLGAA